jgi:hypothetical protein
LSGEPDWREILQAARTLTEDELTSDVTRSDDAVAIEIVD